MKLPTWSWRPSYIASNRKDPKMWCACKRFRHILQTLGARSLTQQQPQQGKNVLFYRHYASRVLHRDASDSIAHKRTSSQLGHSIDNRGALPIDVPVTSDLPPLTKRSNLLTRARRAPITLVPSVVERTSDTERWPCLQQTPGALQQLKLLQTSDAKLLRIGVKNKGCSGLSYNLEYVLKPSLLDEMVEQDGILRLYAWQNKALKEVG